MTLADTTDAVVAVLRRKGLVLIIQRGPGVIFPGYWTPLSGRVKAGESQESAVVREVEEEVGLRAKPIKKVWECDTEDSGFHLHWWLAEAAEGGLRLDPDEVSDACWIRPEEFTDFAPIFADDRFFFTRILPHV